MIYIDRKSLMNKLQITKNAIIYLEKRCNIAKRNYKHVYYTEEELNIILDLVKKEFLLPEDAKQIPNSFDYATPNGEIYKQKFKRCKLYYKANLSINLGYVYGIINFTDVLYLLWHSIVLYTNEETDNPFPRLEYLRALFLA